MITEKIISKLKELTRHEFIEIVKRGNSAINSALSLVSGTVLIPDEGGWLSYKTAPLKLGLKIEEVKCNEAKINLADLKKKLLKLSLSEVNALLYQNPGGYFAEQEMEQIYSICKEKGCLVILDVSGSIGTRLCNGDYADLLVGSFGKWKLVDAGRGGFISAREEVVWNELKNMLEKLDEQETLFKISKGLKDLPQRIAFLKEKKREITAELLSKKLKVVKADDEGFVVIVKFNQEEEREKLISYCKYNHLEWTECPRYIRLMKKAISIEVKRL